MSIELVGVSEPVVPTTVTTMRTATIVAPGRTVVKVVPLPVPGHGQVRIRIEGCGVCASNVPVWEGREWFDYPQPAGSPGHEAWGWIDSVGPGVDDVVIGDRVAALTYNGFAEYDIADATQVVRLPRGLETVPFPGEPLGCAMNIYRRSEVRAGQNVAIVGTGFLGALLAQLASADGANVIAISRRASALEHARAFGATATLEMNDHAAVVQRVMDLTDGRGCDRVIEATGKQWPLDLAGELAAERGRLVIAGYHQDGPRAVNMQLWNWRGLDVINAHERDPRIYVDGIREAVAAVESGRLDPAPLYTHRFGLDEIDQAIALTRDRPDGFMKALVMP